MRQRQPDGTQLSQSRGTRIDEPSRDVEVRYSVSVEQQNAARIAIGKREK